MSKQYNNKKLSRISEGIECEAQTIDWINTLQFAIKDVANDESLPEFARLSRVKSMAEIAVYLADEARDGLQDYADVIKALGGAND